MAASHEAGSTIRMSTSLRILRGSRCLSLGFVPQPAVQHLK